MTRIDISDAVWNRFRAIAVARGIGTPQLLGSVVTRYATPRRKFETRIPRLVVEQRQKR